MYFASKRTLKIAKGRQAKDEVLWGAIFNYKASIILIKLWSSVKHSA